MIGYRRRSFGPFGRFNLLGTIAYLGWTNRHQIQRWLQSRRGTSGQNKKASGSMGHENQIRDFSPSDEMMSAGRRKGF